MNDDQHLEYVQRKRMELAQSIEDACQGMPKSTEDRVAYLTTLKHIGDTAVAKKKVGVDERLGESANKAMVAAILAGMNPKSGQIVDGAITDVTRRQIPVLDDRVPKPNLVKNETTQGAIHDNYESFQARQHGDDVEIE